ncbi:MAG: DUF3040 domain-containing protein [Actinobacteria bacterium]|nr:DUF3040 domain-containing protein [Actinomycetota bacterium]
MPLSEHEQRLLEQMERAFYEEDPQFASAMESPRLPLARRTGLAVVAAVVGLGAIVTGLSAQQPLIGVVGFIALVFGGYLIVTRPATAPAVQAAPAARVRKSARERLDERWDRRRQTD